MPIRKHPGPRKKDQPHDAVFKAFFGDARIARKYLLHYTPDSVHGQIDFAVFEKSNTAFVSGRFGISFSDVLYETRLISGGLARLMFLFEHKSYLPSQPVHLQLLDYLLQIWEDDLKNKRPLSLIIPIVVYHGSLGWEQKSFSDCFLALPEGWKQFIPGFQYLLTDLSRVPSQVIEDKIQTEYLRNLFLALKFARNRHMIKENWEKVFNFESPSHQEDRARILLQTLTLYIVNLLDMPNTEVKDLNKQLPETERSWINEIPEIFGERYKQEGRQQGRSEISNAIALKTMQKFPDWTDAEVAEFVGIKIAIVQALRKTLK